ncbi:MAG TPA: 3-phosphoshikimate 1-carboxyvinyltransferase [Bacillales bacterium]|nr:3-phosphoshikimate 1-carboxyvinyltransferase [Bacillales bacterium]
MAQQADLKARSPWAALNDVNEVEISPAADPIHGEMTIPGSKSFTNRALILASMAIGPSLISGILKSDDSFWCIDALKKLGTEIQVGNDAAHIDGTGAKWPNQKADLYIGASGTNGRFLPGALAAARKGSWQVEASKGMSKRPIGTLIEALRELGGNIEYLENDGFFPIRVDGNGFQGGDVSISGKVSSQFISGLLMAAPYAKEPVTVHVTDHIVQHAYVHITLDLMREFGVDVEADQNLETLKIHPGKYKGRMLQLEADASTTCYFLAMAAITNGKIRIANISYETRQPDIKMVDIFEEMGCTVTRGNGFIELEGTPQLKGGKTISMKEMSDQALTLAAVAVFADEPITITGVAHIRHHESNRIEAVCESLARLGIQVEEHEDGLTVYPGTPKPATLDSYDDHRVAMSLSLIGARVPGIKISDPGCVSKTCPTYFELLEQLGLGIKFS